MKVMKFGGTSVGSVESILSLKKIVEEAAANERVIVVVSALGGITDKLIKTANLADAMILYECITCRIGALVHAGHGELAVVGASLVSACFRYFFLWYCHVYTSSFMNTFISMS